MGRREGVEGMERKGRVTGTGRGCTGGVRTEKLGRKVRAQDDGALAGATDMRPSTSIEGCTAIESAGFSPPPSRCNLLCHLLRSFPSRRSSDHLISTTCIRGASRSEQRFKIVTNHSCSFRQPRNKKLWRGMKRGLVSGTAVI